MRKRNRHYFGDFFTPHFGTEARHTACVAHNL